MISYRPFWETLENSRLNQYRLIRYHHISPAQLTRMHKNMYVSTRTIERLCNILDCKPNDIFEFL